MNSSHLFIKTIQSRLTYILIVFLFATSYPVVAFGQQIASWNFESGVSAWIRASNVKIELSPMTGGKKALHAYGTTTGGTVLSSPWPGEKVAPNALVRVSALIYIPTCNSNTYIKNYFLDKGKKFITNAVSNSYDAVRSGTWQRLIAEARVPETGQTMYLSIVQESGGQFNLFLDDVTIEYTDKIRPLGPLAGTPVPAVLQPFAGIHPRLFITSACLTELQGKIRTVPYKALWRKLKAKADAVPAPVAVFPVCSSAISQRSYGYILPRLAFAWLLTRDSRYLDPAITIATAMVRAPSWGGCAALDKDHVTGVVLFGLSVFYDWCYDAISPQLRSMILAKISSVSSTMAASLLSGSHADPWWKNAYLCNQMPVAVAGLAAAGLATFDELEDAPAWIQLAVDKTENTLAVRGDDGGHIEGIGYWGYDLDSLLKTLHLFQQLLGISLYQNEWLKNTAMFRLYMGLPRNSWTRRNQVVDFNDSTRVNWYGPDTLLRGLAKVYQNPYIQWLASEVDRENYTNDVSEWLNLLWIDPALKPEKPNTLPTLKHFGDLDVVSARSDWNGDESLLVYTAGPLMGHKALRVPTAGRLFAEHMHPDVGHFILFGSGEWQLRDDGYWDDSGKENPKATENHNTLVIDGFNQLRADEMFLKKAEPYIVRTYSSVIYDLIQSDLAQAYRAELGLTKFKRTIIFVKPDILIVIDDVALTAAHRLDLLFHTQSPVAEEGGVFVARGQRSILRIEDFPKGEAESYAGNALYSNMRLTMPTVRLRKTSDRWRNAMAFSWSVMGTQPQIVRMRVLDKKWIFNSRGRTIIFDWDTESLSVEAGPAAPTDLRVE